MHGSLVDVYGVGLLLTGPSGIGKSEIALDLVERGHRLVADDVVKVIRREDNVLIGSGIEMLEHHLGIAWTWDRRCPAYLRHPRDSSAETDRGSG